MIPRFLVGLLITALLLAAGLLALALDTQAGARWLAREAETLSDGAVRFEAVSGTLASGLEIGALVVDAGTTQIRADAVSVVLDLAQLLRGRIVVADLDASRLSIVATDGARKESSPFRSPEISLPLPLEIDALDIETLELPGEPPVVLTGVHLAGSLRGSTLTVRELRGAAGDFALRLAGEARLVPALPLDARVEWRFAGRPLSGAGTVHGDLDAVSIVQSLRVPGLVRVTATVRQPADEPQVGAKAQWNTLAFDLPGLGAVIAEEGSATLDGTLNGWTATATGKLRGANLPAVRAEVAARGDRDRVLLEAVRLAGDAGALSAAGELTLAAMPRLRLEITAKDVHTAVLRPGLAGRLSARAILDARLPGEARLQVSALRGELMGRPVTGSGGIGYRDGLISFEQVLLQAGPNRLQADGTLGERLGGSFALDAPDLSLLWPGLAGSLAAQASLSGSRARPVVALEGRGRAIALGDNTVGQLDLRLRVDALEQIDAQLTAAGVRAGEAALGDLTAALQGSLAAHRLEAQLRNGTLSADLQSSGGWDGVELVHRVGPARIAAGDLGEWRLEGQPQLTLRADAIEAGAHCWTQAPASLCVSALAWSEARAQLAAQLRELDLQRLASWVPESFTLAGRAGADVDLLREADVLTGEASWRQEGTRLSYTGGDEELAADFDTAQVTVTFMPGQATAILALAGEAGVQLDGRARMGAPLGADAPLEARFTGQLPDIAPLAPLLAGDIDLADVTGAMTLDVAVAGSLREPLITGTAQLAGGAVALTDLGVKLEEIDVAVVGDGSPVLRVQGSANAGGALSLTGELRPLDAGGPAGFINVRGERLDAVRLADRFVQASPDVTVSYSRGKARVAGEVLIPKADVVVRELPDSAISTSPDTIVVDREAAAAAAPAVPAIGGEITVSFGDDVRLRGFGLDTRLAGSVKLSESASGEPQGFGVVRLVEGKIGAYGKELTIDRGTLGFAGPLDDPLVDLRASRRVDWEGRRVTAGILVSGPATRTQSRVFSEPAMSEADALSYLVTGRPLQRADSDERSAIAGAALALGVQQTSPLTERVGSAVTLDELGVQGGDVDETEVVAGKQLGSDLYVRFTYGLFNRIGTVLARYRLSRNLSIEAASGEDQSLDLVWSIERE